MLWQGQEFGKQAMVLGFGAAAALWTLLPFLIMFLSSFKDLLDAFQLPAPGDWGGVSMLFTFEPTTRFTLPPPLPAFFFAAMLDLHVGLIRGRSIYMVDGIASKG